MALDNDKNNAALVDVAMGRQPADLVITNGRWVSVQSGEIISQTSIAVKNGRIAYVGPDASHTVSDSTKVIDADDKYLVPGLIDAHMHVESGMLTVSEFVRAVLPHGTTSLFIDPHEMANVFGLNGIKLMVDEAAVQPVHVWVQVPSCVPSAPGFETPGATLSPSQITDALSWPGVIGLGEVMDFPGVIRNDPRMVDAILAAQNAGKVIGGHYASLDLGLPFHGYAAGGPEDDHEGTTLDGALARVRQGMKVMMRFGSSWRDVAEQVRAVTEKRLDSRHFLLCTDDSHALTLVREGHVNRSVRVAIACGVPPVTAIQMATLNAAEHFGVSGIVGMIAPRRSADILILPDLREMTPDLVIAQGIVVAQKGRLSIDKPEFRFPDWSRRSVRLSKPINEADFRLEARGRNEVNVNVIGLIENQAPNRHLKMRLPVKNGEIHPDIESDIAKIALVERHHNSGRVQVGLVKGFGFRNPCAVASTVAHDSHHLLVAGTSTSDMVIAVNTLAEYGGGQIVVRQGEILGCVPLPIGGLMSDLPASEVARQTKEVLAGFRSCGSKMSNPNMQLSLAALVVIPELRLSDLGLVNVNDFKFIPVVESE